MACPYKAFVEIFCTVLALHLRNSALRRPLSMTMNLIFACGSINAPADGCGWEKPISVAEEDRLTTATKRALLAHNEAWSEFCK